MTTLRSLALLAPGGAALVLAEACSSSNNPNVIEFPSMRDVSEAPPAIQAAAQAVVRIETNGALATGSFISADGVLLTNNHVLGVDVCPREGCYASLRRGYQRHAVPPPADSVFVVPVAVDIGLDMALVQCFAGTGAGPHLSTPHFLTISPEGPSALLGTRVHLVGHPEGHLKKWSQGQVVDASGSWIFTSTYGLPGNSGSPFLNDSGELVGILHRGPGDQDLISNTGIDEYSIGTASSALVPALTAALPSALVSIGTDVTDDEVVAREAVYLNAHAANATVNGAARPVLTSLGAACDAGLARTDYASPEDMAAALTPCTAAEQWIECQSGGSVGGFNVCPPDASAWEARFQAVSDHYRALNGSLDLEALTFAQEALFTSSADGAAAAKSSLSAALAQAAPPLDFNLTEYLAAFQIGSYEGTDVVSFVRNYASFPDYALSATAIATSALYLSSSGLGASGSVDLLEKLSKDSTVNLGTKLYIENVLFDSGYLQ